MWFGQVVEFWNWFWMSIGLFTFLCLTWSKRRTNCTATFLMKSPNLCYILKGPQNTIQNSTKHSLRFNANFNIQHSVKMTGSTPLSRSFCIFRRCNFHLHQLLSHTMVDYGQLECNDNIFFSNFSFRMWKGKHRACESVDLHQYFHSLEKIYRL